jgi:hypothetical protein
VLACDLRKPEDEAIELHLVLVHDIGPERSEDPVIDVEGEVRA